LGFLLMSLVCLLCTPTALPAASEKATGVDNEAGRKSVADTAPLEAEETRIYPGDLLYIQVFDVDQMTREYRVSATGTLTFPLLPEAIPAAGLTPAELAEAISRKCIEAGVLSHPQISVMIRESRLHGVAITGAVRSPQIYPVFARTTLLDLLTLAGGVNDTAGGTVTITRGEVSRRILASEGEGAAEGGKSQLVPSTVTIDLRQLLDTADPKLNVAIYPGDRVAVQHTGIVYAVGAVNRPGGYALRSAEEELSVLELLALAGNPTNTAARSKAVIIRQDPKAPRGRKEIPVDLKKLIHGKVPDPPLMANDILVVPDSNGAKGIRKAGDEAVWIGTSLVLWGR
jgi:polysaccharide export outer membrane protein